MGGQSRSVFFPDCTEELLLFFWPSLSLECHGVIWETMLSLRIRLADSLMQASSLSIAPSQQLLLRFLSQALENSCLPLPWYHHLPQWGTTWLCLNQSQLTILLGSGSTYRNYSCALCLANLRHKSIYTESPLPSEKRQVVTGSVYLSGMHLLSTVPQDHCGHILSSTMGPCKASLT